MLNSHAEEFERKGYTVVRKALGAQAAILYTQAALLQKPKYWLPEPAHRSRGRYADANGEAILFHLQPLVEQIVGRELYPCYSYLRIYSEGSELKAHTDRPSCEYSVTMTIGHGRVNRWPIYIESDGGESAVDLEPGDFMVYKGAALAHRREGFSGDFWVQLFLHYVDARGPYAHYRFDGRQRLGPFNINKEERRLPDPSNLRPDEGCWCGSGKAFKDCHGAASDTGE